MQASLGECESALVTVPELALGSGAETACGLPHRWSPRHPSLRRLIPSTAPLNYSDLYHTRLRSTFPPHPQTTALLLLAPTERPQSIS